MRNFIAQFFTALSLIGAPHHAVSARPLGPVLPLHPLVLAPEQKLAASIEKTLPHGKIHGVPVLVYHTIMPVEPNKTQDYNIAPETFDAELAYLKDSGFHVISFGDMLDAENGKGTLPEHAVVITFDDGWRTQYTQAFPVLKKYNDTATFFVYTDMVGSKMFFTWDQIRELAASGMTIGSHTESHPVLTRMQDAAQLAREISGSKKLIESEINQPVRYFAYPYFAYDARVIAAVQFAGYDAARGGAIVSADGANNPRYAVRAFLAPGNLDSFKYTLSRFVQ